MAILDAAPVQDWIRAFDNWDRAQRRLNAAQPTLNQTLIEYLKADVENARLQLNAALKALNDG